MSHILSNRSKNRLEFSIHRAALPAFSFFHSRHFWVDKAVIQQLSLDEINVGLTLQAIRISHSKIAIISGFESFSFSLTTLKLIDCEVLIHDKMSDVEVEKRAWLAVLRTMLSSIDNKSAEDFRRALNQQAPNTIIKSLFDKNKLSQKQLSAITHSSRSSLAQQNAKAQLQETPSNEEPSIFERLLQEKNEMFEGVKERFKHKNIERFLTQLFPFDESHNALIATEVIRLCAVIREEYRNEFPEIPFLVSEAQRVQRSPASANLHDIVISISNSKNLGVHYLPAFLSSNLLLTSYDRKKFDQYKALTFLSVARLSFIGTHQSKIKDICNDVRLFANGKRETMAAYLPDIEQLNFHQLVEAFQTLVDEENDDRPPNQVVDKLNHYRRPYESTLNYSDGYTRNVTSSEFKKSGRLEQGELKTLDDDGEEGLFELTQFNEGPKSTSHSWQKEDHHGESSRTTSIVSSYTHTQPSYAAGALHARAIQARIEKRDMSLACDIDSATIYEIGALVRYCMEQIGTNSNTLMAAKLLLVMLFSGSTYTQAKKLKSKRSSRRKLVGFCRKHRLPSQKQRTELLPLLTKTTVEFWLPLPLIVCHGLSSLTFRDVEEAELKGLLSYINKRHDTHLTLRKVTSYLRQKLSHENVDSTIIALLTGEVINTIPAVFYLQLSHGYLLQTYNRYLDFLSHLTLDPSALTLFDEIPSPLSLGSPLYIETDVLSSLFSHLQSKLNSKQPKDECFHNDITIYTQLILAIASGYRPVTGWFGKITHLSLQTGDYWISDKESGIGDNSRVIKLPDITIKILDNYLSYCKRRVLQLANTQPELSLEYKRLLTGETHLFFYLRESQYEPCTPSNYTFFIDSVFPLQANWARHHARSLLTAKGVDTSVINAWMGHMNQSKRSFHEFSTLTRQHMVTISNILNEHLLDIGVEAAYD